MSIKDKLANIGAIIWGIIVIIIFLFLLYDLFFIEGGGRGGNPQESYLEYEQER